MTLPILTTSPLPALGDPPECSISMIGPCCSMAALSVVAFATHYDIMIKVHFNLFLPVYNGQYAYKYGIPNEVA